MSSLIFPRHIYELQNDILRVGVRYHAKVIQGTENLFSFLFPCDTKNGNQIWKVGEMNRIFGSVAMEECHKVFLVLVIQTCHRTATRFPMNV